MDCVGTFFLIRQNLNITIDISKKKGRKTTKRNFTNMSHLQNDTLEVIGKY